MENGLAKGNSVKTNNDKVIASILCLTVAEKINAGTFALEKEKRLMIYNVDICIRLGQFSSCK